MSGVTLKRRISSNTDFEEVGTIVVKEGFPWGHIEYEYGGSRTYINEDGTLAYAALPVVRVSFHPDETPSNEVESRIQESLAKIEEDWKVNKILAGKNLFMLLSETSDGNGVLTLPTLFSENYQIYGGSTRIYVAGTGEPVTIGPQLGDQVIGLYASSDSALPELGDVIGFHEHVADKREIVPARESLQSKVASIPDMANAAYKLICEQAKRDLQEYLSGQEE